MLAYPIAVMVNEELSNVRSIANQESERNRCRNIPQIGQAVAAQISQQKQLLVKQQLCTQLLVN